MLNIFKLIYKNYKNNNEKTISESVIKPKGLVTIWENEQSDENIIFKQQENLIVNTFFDILTGCLTGDTDKIITKLHLGDGGVVDSILQTPSLTDLYLYNKTLEKAYKSYSIETLTGRYISYLFEIEKEEGNGSGAAIYNEIALASADDTIFSRKTFDSIVKTNEKTIIIEWRIEF